MVNAENMDVGYAFAYAFQRACMATIQDNPNLRLYQVHGYNPNTIFILANGDREITIDTKARLSTGNYHWFGINAIEWRWWQHPDRVQLPVVEVVVLADGAIGNGNQHMRPMCPVAILAYAGYRPENERLYAQWIPNIIKIMPGGPVVLPNGEQVFDTVLASYANLSIILQQGIGVDEHLAQQVEQQTLANALATPILNPNAG